MNNTSPDYSSYFRQYDIRGIVDDLFNSKFANILGLAVSSVIKKYNIDKKIIIGYDGRNSSPELKIALSKGFIDSGVDVIDIGMLPTPLTYFARATLNIPNAIMITGSHNSKIYNGFKMMLDNKSTSAHTIQEIKENFDVCLQEMQTSAYKKLTEQPGKIVKDETILDKYIDFVTKDKSSKRNLKIVVDSGNGVAGIVAPKLLRKLGYEVIDIFSEVDGSFPNHHPDPSKKNNLVDLIKATKSNNADCGIAFDGDADRLGVVDENGNIVESDRILMLLAKDILRTNKGRSIIYDVKCSYLVERIVRQLNGRPIMVPTGHSIVKNKILEYDAVLAGELSGHIFFNDSRWFGFDDAIYSAVRFLETVSSYEKSISEILNDIPQTVTTTEVNLSVGEKEKFEIINRVEKEIEWEGAEKIIKIDGVRVEFEYGWGLIRASNTSPIMVFRFEAKDVASLNKIISLFMSKLSKIIDDLSPLYNELIT